MGHWGVKSYENDEASDALDAGFERVHGALYDELMDDRNPMSYDQVFQKLAGVDTFDASLAALRATFEEDSPPQDWDAAAKLALVGIVVRHAELRVPIPQEWLACALDWLENEQIDWEEQTIRDLRKRKEIDLLTRISRRSEPSGGEPKKPPDEPGARS